jgi:hypothetical protein
VWLGLYELTVLLDNIIKQIVEYSKSEKLYDEHKFDDLLREKTVYKENIQYVHVPVYTQPSVPVLPWSPYNPINPWSPTTCNGS